MAKAAWMVFQAASPTSPFVRRLFAVRRLSHAWKRVLDEVLVASGSRSPRARHVLVVAVAAAGLAMLVDVLVIVSMAVAGGLAVLCERAGNEGLDAGIAAALGARIDRDAGLGKRVDGAAADTAANERVNATVGKQARQGAVTGATGAYDLLVEHLAILDVVDLELLAAAKVHKDVAVVVRRCHPHGADLLCWPCGRRRGDGGSTRYCRPR